MRALTLLLGLLVCVPALAQKDMLFGKGKPPVFREEDMDRRFKKTKFYKMLNEGTDDPACLQVMGGLLTALGEIAPLLHARDEKFSLDPFVMQAVNAQLTTPRFPAMAYLLSMVRRVLIDRRLPDQWLATAEAINDTVQIIDLAKLKLLNEGLKPISSFYFTLPSLRERYELEVLRANSAVTTDVAAAFRDAYLDREVAWGNLILIDTGVKARGKMKQSHQPLAVEELGAVLQWYPPDPTNNELVFTEVKKPPPVTLYVHLAPKQFIDLEKVPRGKRMLVKGRFWEMNRTVTEVEIRDALLFEDRDFSRGVILGDPNAIMGCPAAINDLTGTAQQPGGFKH